MKLDIIDKHSKDFKAGKAFAFAQNNDSDGATDYVDNQILEDEHNRVCTFWAGFCEATDKKSKTAMAMWAVLYDNIGARAADSMLILLKK